MHATPCVQLRERLYRMCMDTAIEAIADAVPSEEKSVQAAATMFKELCDYWGEGGWRIQTDEAEQRRLSEVSTRLHQMLEELSSTE